MTLSGAGPHSLRLTKPGFVPQEVNLTEADLRKGAASYTLAAVEITRVPVAIRSAYPVDVWSGSQALSRSKENHQRVPTGTRLRIGRRVFLNDTVTVSAKGLQYSARRSDA